MSRWVSKGMQAVKLGTKKPPVFNGRCWLMQVDLYNGSKMVVDVVAACWVSSFYYLLKTNADL